MSNGGTPNGDDTRLVPDLTTLNGQISRYVLRHLDAEANRVTPTSPNDEWTLGLHLVRFGLALLERAERRAAPAGH
jgi:hypothetical protein